MIPVATLLTVGLLIGGCAASDSDTGDEPRPPASGTATDPGTEDGSLVADAGTANAATGSDPQPAATEPDNGTPTPDAGATDEGAPADADSDTELVADPDPPAADGDSADASDPADGQATPAAAAGGFDEEAAIAEAVEQYRDIRNPLNASERHAYVRDLITSFEYVANRLEWATVGNLLDDQQESHGGQAVYDLVHAWWEIRDRRAAGASAPDDDPWATRIDELTRTPRFAWPHFFLASLALQESNYDQALEHVNKALVVNPDFLEARRLKTATMISAAAPEFKRFSRTQVLATIEETLSRKPDDIGPELQLLAALGELDRVRQILESAKTPAVRAQCEYLLGYHTDREQTATARQHFAAAIEASNAEATDLRSWRYLRVVGSQARYQLAASLFSTEPRDREKAFTLIHEVRELNPEAGLALSLLVQMVAVSRDADHALRALDWMLDQQAAGSPRIDLLNWMGGMIRVVDVRNRFGELPLTRIWTQLAADLQAADELNESEEQFVIDLLQSLLRTPDDRATGLPQPLPADRLGASDDEPTSAAMAVIIEWLRLRADHDEFRIRLPAIDMLGLLVGASGVNSDRFVELARSVMGQAPGTADDRKSAWARALAIHGLSLRARDAADAEVVAEASARTILGAMEAAVEAEDTRACRQFFDNAHRALRALVASGVRPDWKSRNASLSDYRSLTTLWRDRLP